MKVAVFGLGYVCTVTAAACLASHRHDVWGVDVGANRQHIEAKLPHLGRLLMQEPGDALRGADVAVISSVDPAIRAALLAAPPPRLLDLNGRVGPEIEDLPGYEGIGW